MIKEKKREEAMKKKNLSIFSFNFVYDLCCDREFVINFIINNIAFGCGLHNRINLLND